MVKRELKNKPIILNTNELAALLNQHVRGKSCSWKLKATDV